VLAGREANDRRFPAFDERLESAEAARVAYRIDPDSPRRVLSRAAQLVKRLLSRGNFALLTLAMTGRSEAAHRALSGAEDVGAGLDGQSAAFVTGAERVAEALMTLHHEAATLDWTVDFSPAAQGLWKAFERELNLSVVQAARESRGARLPAYFAKYDPAMARERSRVHTGRDDTGVDREVDVNRKESDPTLRGRHRFLTLGDAWYVRKALEGRADEEFDAVLRRSGLPDGVTQDLDIAWRRMRVLRNLGSHTEPLAFKEFAELRALFGDRAVMGQLARLKEALRSPEVAA
jgi:hypothetical protein